MGRWVNKYKKDFTSQRANRLMGYKLAGSIFLAIAFIFILDISFSSEPFIKINGISWNNVIVILFNIIFLSLVVIVLIFLSQIGIAKLSSLFAFGKIEVVCTNCFDKKLGFDNTPCTCGGLFKDLRDYVWESDENDLDNNNILVKSHPSYMFLMITKYYRTIEELPLSVRCAFCFSIINLNTKCTESRLIKCDNCQQVNNYRIPKQYFSFGKINPKFKIDPIFLQNFNFQSRLSSLNFSKINRLRELSRLPSEISCPICNEVIYLDDNSKNSRFVFCKNCKTNLNLTVKNKDPKIILKESTTL